MLQKRSRQIDAFIREHPKNPCDQNRVIVSLASPSPLWIVLNEKPEGFEAQVCSSEKTALKNATEWLCNLAKECGYNGIEKQEVKQGKQQETKCRDEAFASGENNAVQKEKVTLPSSVFEKLQEVVASIFRCCVNPGEKNMEDAYGPTTVNGQLSGLRPLGAVVEVPNLAEENKPTKRTSTFHSEEVTEKAPSQSRQPTQKPHDPMHATIRPYYELLLCFIAESLQFEEITKLKAWATKKVQQAVTLQEKSVMEILRQLERSNIICPTNMKEFKEFSSTEILRFDIVHAIDCYHAGDYTLLTTSVNGWNGPTTVRSSYKRGNTTNRDIRGSSLVLGASRNEQHNAINQPQVVSPKGANGNPPFSNGNGNLEELFGNSPSNGKKLSKLVADNPDAHNNPDGPWLCSHYKRRCYVKFDCCNQYWPCHRCHNNESKCGKRKLRSRDTKFIKCTRCSTEQQVTSHSYYPGPGCSKGDHFNRGLAEILATKF